MSTDIEGNLRQAMEHATAGLELPSGLARRAARHRQRRIVIRTCAAVATAAVVAAAGIVVAVRPSAPVVRPSAPAVLTVKLLADRASAAALTQPTVSPGQWVYRVTESSRPFTRSGVPKIITEAGWETADGGETYGDNVSVGINVGAGIPAYSQLGSLPASPAALDAYLARLDDSGTTPPPDIRGVAAFSSIAQMLINYVLPPTLGAEIYQALALIPGIKVDSHVTAIDGQAGVAFVLPPTPQSEQLGIILDASSYRFLAQENWVNATTTHETAVVRMVIVGAPGSTQPSLTPPTAAELLAEQADRAVTFTNAPPLYALPKTWILRELATASGDKTIWATADDSEQASYVHGKLVVCARTAACAKSTQWLMPAGPSYTLVSPPIPAGRPPFKHLPPSLPDTLPQLLAALNAYRTGCADVAGDCNAVNAMTNIIAGYGYRNGLDGNWFLMLADIPGVTVQRVTDVTGHADIAFRYPFSDGVTEILLGAGSHQFAGYVRDGAETVITKEIAVSGPGSRTQLVLGASGVLVPAGH